MYFTSSSSDSDEGSGGDEGTNNSDVTTSPLEELINNIDLKPLTTTGYDDFVDAGNDLSITEADLNDLVS